MRLGRFAVTYDDGAAFCGRVEKQLREIKRKSDATVAGRIAGQLTRMHRDATPCKPLHVRHGRVVILFGVMLPLLLKNREDTWGRGPALRATADGGATNQDPVAINVHRL